MDKIACGTEEKRLFRTVIVPVSLPLLDLSAAAWTPRFAGSGTPFQQFGVRARVARDRVRATNVMGAACCGGTAYVEKPFSGIQSNGQYVVDGVVIPRREMSKEEAARRGLKDDDWRGSMFGRTSEYIVAPALLACRLIMVVARRLHFR